MGPILPYKEDEKPLAFGDKFLRGITRKACTNTGRQVAVWTPDPKVTDPNRKYFCHGHALGTHNLWGFTVYSGQSLRTVLQDEWCLVGSVHNVIAGDIVIWHNEHKVKAPVALPTAPTHKMESLSSSDLKGKSSDTTESLVKTSMIVPSAPRVADHSALIISVAKGPVSVDVTRTMLSSKNGAEPLQTNISLEKLIATYGNVYAIYRPQLPSLQVQ